MKRLLTSIATVFTVLLLNTFGLAIHASAMPMTSHEISGMNQGLGGSINCVTLCRTAVINKDETINSRYDEEDDEPTVPFYAQNQDWQFSEAVVNQKLYADSVKPPQKVPIYILHTVFRV